MKVIRPVFALQAASLAIFFAGAVQAGDANAPAPAKMPPYSKQALQSKIEYCQTCHGVSAEGTRGSVPIPRLAGQQVKYLENQLRNFILHRRVNNVMSNAVQQMGSAEMTALAAYFYGLNPKPLGGAPRDLVDAGKKIYEEGIPETSVSACASCHGPEAKGEGVYPRLAGQINEYVVNKLVNWDRERGRDPAVPAKSASAMKSVTHNLTNAQIAAVASYLNYLE
jgi:cytochrome c553